MYQTSSGTDHMYRYISFQYNRIEIDKCSSTKSINMTSLVFLVSVGCHFASRIYPIQKAVGFR